MASLKTVTAIETLARADRRHASSPDDWDQDAWLLNTPTGTIDLRTGIVRPHSRDDKITKITAAGPGGVCPVWEATLQRIFAGDKEVVSFVQRMLGYCLTGSTREHALFFCYGTGGNGKGVFLNTLNGILGEYATTAPMTAFTASNNDRHPTELAMLRGARVVAAQETEAGQRWAESKLKTLTGGDRIAARFMRQDFFTFQPVFKLLIAGNYKPALKSVDEAIRRRFNLIPFTVTIPAEERDPDLIEKLKSEWPGILSWCIQGCLEWQRIGLAPPEVILAATEDYLNSEDSIGRFIADYCERDKSATEETNLLYERYKDCCQNCGEYPVSMKRFSQSLVDRHFEQAKDSATRRSIFRGIKLLGSITPPLAPSVQPTMPSRNAALAGGVRKFEGFI